MAKPTKSDILSGRFSFDGSPFVRVTTSPSIDVDTLEYSLDGSPWYGTETEPTSPSSVVKSISAVPYANVKKVMALAFSSVKTIANKTP